MDKHVTAVKYNHNGKLLAVARKNGLVELWSAEHNELVVSTSPPCGYASQLVFLDEKLMAVGPSGCFFSWDFLHHKQVDRFQQTRMGDLTIISPDGRFVASTRNLDWLQFPIRGGYDPDQTLEELIDETYLIIDTLSSEMPIWFHTAYQLDSDICWVNLYELIFSPDSKRFAYSLEIKDIGWEYRIYMGEISDNGVNLESCFQWSCQVGPMVFSPDSQKLAFADLEDNSIEVIKADGKSTNCVYGIEARTTCLAFSPDGNKLVFACEDGAVGIWSLDNDKPQFLCNLSSLPTAIDFNPDGKIAVVGDKSGEIWFVDA